MKKIIIAAISFLVISPAVFAQTKAGKKDTTQHTTYYTCPKHPDVVKTAPGKCPQCGMQLNLSDKEQMKTNATRSYSCPVHVEEKSHHPGKCPQCGKPLNLSPKEQMKAATVKIYTCPMHPEIALNKEGNCPKCGKRLTEKKGNK